VKPNCEELPSLCSPSAGHRRAGTFVTPCTLNGAAIVEVSLPPALRAERRCLGRANCGSLITSCGLRATTTKVTWMPLSTSSQCAIGCALKTSSRTGPRSCPHVRRQLRRIGEPRIAQEIGAADRLRDGCHFVRRDEEHEPYPVGGLVDVSKLRFAGFLRSCGAKKLCLAQRALDRDARRPDSLGKQRGR